MQRIAMRGWEKMLTAATAAVPREETISRSAAGSSINKRPSAAAGQANRQNSLRMAIGDQWICRLDAQSNRVVEDDAITFSSDLLQAVAGHILQMSKQLSLLYLLV